MLGSVGSIGSARVFRALMVSLSLLALAAPASAQAVEGALRLHLETGLFGVSRLTRTRSDGSSSSGTILSVGPNTTGLGVGAGFGVSERVIVGGNLSFQLLSLSDDDSETQTATRVTLAPYAEVLLGEGSARPFLGVQGSFGYTKSDNSWATTFGVMGQVGAHFFVSDGGSFDVSARPFIETANDDDDDTTTSYGVLVMLGVSAWGH